MTARVHAYELSVTVSGARLWKSLNFEPIASAIRLGLLSPPRYRGGNNLFKRLHVMIIASGGISIFGLFSMNPALFAFLFVTIVFGALNIFEYKRFD